MLFSFLVISRFLVVLNIHSPVVIFSQRFATIYDYKVKTFQVLSLKKINKPILENLEFHTFSI